MNKTLSLNNHHDYLSITERWQKQLKAQQHRFTPVNNTVPEWISDYIGYSFKMRGRDRDGLDCWGLVRLVLKEQFNIDVPSYAADYYSISNEQHISHLIRTHLGFWQPVYPAQPGDCILFRIHKQPSHIGIVVTDSWMLHILHEGIVSLERYDSMRWKRRIVGFYRHKNNVSKNSFQRSRFYSL